MRVGALTMDDLLKRPKSELNALKKDYESMKSMFCGAYPSFEELLDAIALLEKEINSA